MNHSGLVLPSAVVIAGRTTGVVPHSPYRTALGPTSTVPTCDAARRCFWQVQVARSLSLGGQSQLQIPRCLGFRIITLIRRWWRLLTVFWVDSLRCWPICRRRTRRRGWRDCRRGSIRPDRGRGRCTSRMSRSRPEKVLLLQTWSVMGVCAGTGIGASEKELFLQTWTGVGVVPR